MHHARQHAETKTRERRYRVAREAARLMAESGIRDYHQAKRKAAERLGIHDDASLPRNREIEDALREYQRLFQGGLQHASAQSDSPNDDDSQPAVLRRRREAALRALEFFAPFDARLIGPVLDGTADAHTPVQLQLYSDDPDSVARFLQDADIPAESRSRRVRLDRERALDCPVWLFSAENIGFDLCVLPRSALRQAPLSQIDEKPMARATAGQLRALLVDEDIAGFAQATPGARA